MAGLDSELFFGDGSLIAAIRGCSARRCRFFFFFFWDGRKRNLKVVVAGWSGHGGVPM